MKRILLALVAVLVTVFVAVAAIDLPGRSVLKSLSGKDAREISKYIPVIIKFNDEEALREIEEAGSVIFNRRDELVLACVPADRLQDVSELAGVSRVNVGTGLYKSMDKARVMGNADKVIGGVDLPQSYNGAGVVVGFSDIGFDPHHVNFREDSGSRTKVNRIVAYTDTLARRIELSAPEEIDSWVTDHYDQWHATHVAGILTGGYDANGYHGIATASDIVATTSDLSDACILAGVEDVISYAKERNLPAVVNLSVGSYTGPRDGTDLFCQYLDRLGEEAVICISAGNEGYHYNVLSKDFMSDDDLLKTFVFDRSWMGIHVRGMSDLWSSDSRKFQVALCIYDSVDNEILYTSDFMGGEYGLPEFGLASPGCAVEGDVLNDVFDRCFTGYVRLYSELNEENSRYNIMCAYDVVNKDYKGEWGRFCIGLIVKADEGVHVDGYTDGTNSFFRSMGVPGFVDGRFDGTISNIACGRNVIVVGASNSRNVTPLVSGGDKTYDFTEGTVANFTGYGTTFYGKELPHFCAPGNMVVSSMSTPYIESQDDAAITGRLAVKETVDGKDYYWISECGTSMSTPYAAGVFALWLQADPTLTSSEILEIAVSTASKDATDIDDPRWGAGELDAYKGMKEVLSRASAGNIMSDNNGRLLVSDMGNREFAVTVVGAAMMDASIYSVTGSKLVTVSGIGETVNINVSTLASGVYLLVVESDVAHCVERIVVR